MKPDDSFASDFAPLPASADSSCIDVDGGKAGTDRPVNCLTSVPLGDSDGELDSLDEMANTSQDLPLMMKLEQVRTLYDTSESGVSYSKYCSCMGWDKY